MAANARQLDELPFIRLSPAEAFSRPEEHWGSGAPMPGCSQPRWRANQSPTVFLLALPRRTALSPVPTDTPSDAPGEVCDLGAVPGAARPRLTLFPEVG